MNISNWPLQRIMQLPDEAFGRRFLISNQLAIAGSTTAWDISEIGFPEIAVIWEVCIAGSVGEFGRLQFRIALADQLPVSTAMMDQLEPLFPGLGVTGAEPREINTKYEESFCMRRLKMAVRTSGRRLCMELANAGANAALGTVLITVSSIPKDIPSWFG